MSQSGLSDLQESVKPSDAAGHPLDQVIWRALTGIQSHVAEGDERARRYPAAIAPFAATADMEAASFASLLAVIGENDRIALFTMAEVKPPSSFSVIRRDSVDQMIFDDARADEAARLGSPVVSVGPSDVPAMHALVSLTHPGPFGPRTIELGNYVDVRHDGEFVAMAGECMRLDRFTEISAVCVAPAHRGYGFAANLVRSLVLSISARSETPFLHVFSSNHPAIALYRKLGFTLRRRLHLTVLGRAEDGTGQV